MNFRLAVLGIFLCTFQAFSQGIIRGKVFNPINNEPVAFANILLPENRREFRQGGVGPLCAG